MKVQRFREPTTQKDYLHSQKEEKYTHWYGANDPDLILWKIKFWYVSVDQTNKKQNKTKQNKTKQTNQPNQTKPTQTQT